MEQRIMSSEIPEVKSIRYMRWHNSGNIQGENLLIWAVERKTPGLLGHIGLQCMKVGEKKNLGDLALFVWCMLALALKMFSFEQILSLKKSQKKKKNQTKQNKQKNTGPLNGKREKKSTSRE